jgi:hypothetical protein
VDCLTRERYGISYALTDEEAWRSLWREVLPPAPQPVPLTDADRAAGARLLAAVMATHQRGVNRQHYRRAEG